MVRRPKFRLFQTSVQREVFFGKSAFRVPWDESDYTKGEYFEWAKIKIWKKK